MKKKRLSLKVVFLEYLFSMVLALILALSLLYAFFILGINKGLYTYANSSEVQVKNMKPRIAAAKKFNSNLIPPTTKYVYLNNNFTELDSNMNKTDKRNAILYAKGKYITSSLDDVYLSIARNDGYVILHYYIRSRYSVSWMNRYLPNPDKLLIIFSILNSLLACFVVTTLFARHLRKQLRPLMDATQKIKEKNLDFEIQSSGIKEFNHILESISDMKSELKYSLEQQWKMEQTRKEQTSALAHDVKTPLTIIQGNAELLTDTEQTDDQIEFTQYILKNADQMEQYIKMLIDLTQAETGYQTHFREININSFIEELKDQVNGLTTAKKLKVDFLQKKLPQNFTADAVLLQRAIMNVVSNATDYSPEHGKINLLIDADENRIRFCISNDGKGFSPIDLKRATTQFYMGDPSRTLKTHFGIGLHVTESIVKLHKGTLHIANSSKTGGGQVTIEIPIIQS
ncbi:sensor histidine kinase [Sporolactobacillus pectinivorans]|uniref:sensor histidine kinase n=1 Tax=Sporolactobacillus pectinivorans TaxID=1591408 RepID=UPI001EFE3117|nr:HAMP domain-containing sensor histidine kinase [Sporolactobacillus pectinivorans]